MKHEVAAFCPCGCGKSFTVTIECNAPRHNKAGNGYHLSGKITMLGLSEQFAMKVLLEERCSTWYNGLESRMVWKKSLEYYDVNGIKRVVMNSTRRALSYLQGLGFARCEVNQIEVKDPDTLEMKFREKQRWFVPNEMIEAYENFPKKAWPHPKVVQQVLA